MTSVDACRWTYLVAVPAWIPTPTYRCSSQLTTPHSRLHSQAECLLGLVASSATACVRYYLFLLADGDSPVSVAAVAPESALPTPTSHCCSVAQHWPCPHDMRRVNDGALMALSVTYWVCKRCG